MKRKRIVTGLLSISMLFGLLAGCGGRTAASTSAATSESKTEEQQTSAPGVEASSPAEEQEVENTDGE